MGTIITRIFTRLYNNKGSLVSTITSILHNNKNKTFAQYYDYKGFPVKT